MTFPVRSAEGQAWFYPRNLSTPETTLPWGSVANCVLPRLGIRISSLQWAGGYLTHCHPLSRTWHEPVPYRQTLPKEETTLLVVGFVIASLPL